MQTSLKLKTFSRFFIAFLKSTLNFEYLKTKDQSQRLTITEIIDCETGSYLNIQKAIFHAALQKKTCYAVPDTAEISTEPISYHSSNDFG